MNYAILLAEKGGEALPPEVLESSAACSAYIEDKRASPAGAELHACTSRAAHVLTASRVYGHHTPNGLSPLCMRSCDLE